ncbi:MAG: hypothetical protein V4710_01950, partial [Verrucomicrobiota bacterium]
MNPQRPLLAAAWLATVVTAYFLGHQQPPPPSNAASLSETKPSSEPMHVQPGDLIGSRQERGNEGAQREAEPSVAALMSRARVELASGSGNMMNFRGIMRALGPFLEMDGAKLQEALAETERTIRDPQQKMMLYSILLGQWAENDPKGALAYAQQKLDSKSILNMGISSSILGSWARRDPNAAWNWFENEQTGEENERARMASIGSIFTGMAGNNLDVAFGRLASLDESTRNMALGGIAGSATDDASRRRLLDRSVGLPPEQRATIQQAVAARWSFTDPDAAVQWIRSLPLEEQKPLRNSAGSTLMMMNPALGAELMIENVEPKEKPQVYDRIVGRWASQEPRAAGEWLLKQPQGPELDNARRTFATIVSSRDPAAAMDWAGSVQNPVQREQSIGQVFQIWRSKDAAAAETALSATGLPPEKLEQRSFALPGRT